MLPASVDDGLYLFPLAVPQGILNFSFSHEKDHLGNIGVGGE